ncbi:unnamed protein product, partial [Mesorhabditis belari]|uniref:Nuclear receptor domain-containing protein n=1 Tax=Mesorhabditis belari TaxID=2138241 RepID=A0AAF3FFK7_9BILA
MEFPLPQLSLPPRKNSYHTLISYPTGNYTEQSNNWINPSPVSIQTEVNLTSEESFAISKKLEGYAARPHLRAPSIDHDEQIIVDDDDSLPFGDYVTHSGNGIKIYTRGNQNVIVRSPSPVAVRPPIRRDRSEIGRKQRCLVCDTVTSGFHFGAVSCAACSAFFRRTIAERREYTCRAEGSAHLKCEISAEQRCYCRACRLQKCIDVGMDPIAVQPHRDQIGAKRKHDGQRRSMESPVPSADGSLYLNPRIEEVLSGRLARSIGGSPPLKRGKATTALLASNTAYAEQLIALSRQPVISERKAATLTTRHAQSSSPTVSEENDNVVQRESADSDSKKPPTLEEKLPSVNNESNDEGKFIVYEYEIYPGDEGSAESGSKPRSWPSEGKHRISLMPQDKNETDTSNLPDPSENVIETRCNQHVINNEFTLMIDDLPHDELPFL